MSNVSSSLVGGPVTSAMNISVHFHYQFEYFSKFRIIRNSSSTLLFPATFHKTLAVAKALLHNSFHCSYFLYYCNFFLFLTAAVLWRLPFRLKTCRVTLFTTCYEYALECKNFKKKKIIIILPLYEICCVAF